MKTQLLLTALLGAALTAQAGTYEWTTGFGQGISEYLVDDGNGNGLNISCSSEEGQAVRAYASVAGQEYSSEDSEGFDVIVDGTLFSNPFFTDCRVCGSNFPDFWEALRQANNLQIRTRGKTAQLPTQHLSKVLLPLTHAENACQSAW